MDIIELVIRLALIVACLLGAGFTALYFTVFSMICSGGSGRATQRGDPEYWRLTTGLVLTAGATISLLLVAFYVLLKTLNGASLW